MSPFPSTDEVFAAAQAMADPRERSAYLDRVCEGNPGLRQEVESLLAAAGRTGTFLESPAAGAVEVLREIQDPARGPLTEKAGTRIGRYKLLEQIGEGGFGIVWMAEQEEPVRRRVALKIIKLGMDTREVVARFEAERQALAMMDHPHIARVFDGGATDTGRPYFVMELVKGIPITRFCDEQKLSTRERLELFMQVACAVQHAHQKGIIHRDLKPSNILVTRQDERPAPKVIDFGVAKATQARLTEKTMFTRFRQLIGTPAYMSPEQAGLGSADVDTRSDIYSLGVLLYELLTGRTPFDTSKLLEAGYDALMHTIREEEPPKPSTRLSTLSQEELSAVAGRRREQPGRLGRLVHGDLDWIVMQCLEKDRTRRYETAAALVRDVERHLRAEPVSAAAPSIAYRLGKFVRRNRLAAGMSLAIAAALVAATAISLQSALAARKARQMADAERDKACQAQQAEAAQRAMAEASSQESLQRLVKLHTAQGLDLMDRGDWLGASLWFCDALSRAGANASIAEINRIRLGMNLAYAPRLVRMWFHGGPISQSSFSPDGQRVLTAGRDGAVRIWDLAGDRPLGASMPHAGAVLGAEFSSDGRYVVTACEDRTARVWDGASGRAVSPPLVHRLPLERALFRRNNHQVITASGRDVFSWSDDGQFKLKVQRAESEIQAWDPISGRGSQTNYWRDTSLIQITCSPAGRWIAAAYSDGEICFLDDRLQPDKRVRLPADVGRLSDMAFSPDERRLATASASGSVLIWDLASGALLRSLRAASDRETGSGAETLQVSFSPEGRRLMALSRDGAVVFWSVPSGEAAGHLARPIPGAASAVFGPDGRRVAVARATSSGSGETRVWDVDSGQAAGPALPHGSAVVSACFNPDGALLLTAGLDGCARVWNLAASVPPLPPLADWSAPAKAPGDAAHFENHPAAFFNRDGSRLIALERGGIARVWDTASSQPVSPAIHHGQSSATAAFSQDGKRIAIGGGWEIGWARVYEAATGKPITPALACSGPVNSVAFNPDGRWLVTSGQDGARMWDAASGKPEPLPLKGIESVRELVFSPDGQWIATSAGLSPRSFSLKSNWQVQVWRADSGNAAAPAREVLGTQPRLDFSPDGRWLAISATAAAELISENLSGLVARVQILETRTGIAADQLLELREPAGRLRFSPDSARLFLLGSSSGNLTVWDVAQGAAIVAPQPWASEYRLQDIDREGRWLLASAPNGWRLWETASGEPVTPVLGAGLGEAFSWSEEWILPGGRGILCLSGAGLQIWPLDRDRRPLEEITRHVQLLAARELDASGSLTPIEPARLSRLWDTARAAAPEAFGVETNQVALWHLHHAAQSEQARRWSAAEFHLSRLVNTSWDGPQVRQRLSHASAQAALEALRQNP
ncbi:MAG TPA: protein kinase [Candidatus Paceibacterota bacterium]|nr:protein kinase [Candidatus Paceibacterota bacterium]